MDDAGAKAQTAAQDLRSSLRGPVLLPGDNGFDDACQIWNGAVRHRPALIAQCENTADVQRAVHIARAVDLPLSVRGGGHDWAGRALCPDGLVIDLTRLRQVEVDVPGRIATVRGGATASDLIAMIAPLGLAAATGVAGPVGMAGLSLGGGYSPLGSKYGLAVDNLLGVDLVLADGTLVTANEDSEPDLFWAVRGGGGNFGVVTAMRIRLHPLRTVLSGPIMYGWTEAASVLRGHADLLRDAPDELSLSGGVVPGPQGTPVVALTPMWFGEPAEGERVMARWANLGTPLLNRVTTTPYPDLTKMYDAQIVNGRHYATRTRSLADLSDGALDALVTAGDTVPSPLTVITWQHCHGVAARVAPTATAFWQRGAHYQFQLIPAWNPDDPPGARWADDVSTALAPYALPGGYPNLLTDDDDEQVRHAYGDNLPRLAELKRRFDPTNLFRSTPPLPH